MLYFLVTTIVLVLFWALIHPVFSGRDVRRIFLHDIIATCVIIAAVITVRMLSDQTHAVILGVEVHWVLLTVGTIILIEIPLGLIYAAVMGVSVSEFANQLVDDKHDNSTASIFSFDESDPVQLQDLNQRIDQAVQDTADFQLAIIRLLGDLTQEPANAASYLELASLLAVDHERVAAALDHQLFNESALMALRSAASDKHLLILSLGDLSDHSELWLHRVDAQVIMEGPLSASECKQRFGEGFFADALCIGSFDRRNYRELWPELNMEDAQVFNIL